MMFRKSLISLICVSLILLLLSNLIQRGDIAHAQPLIKLEATAGKNKVDLKWNSLPQAEGGYNIYRRTDKGLYPDVPLNEFPVMETNYTDEKGLIPGTTYCYKVRPVGKDLKEIVKIESNEACAATWGEGAPSIIPGKIVLKFKIGDKRYLVNGIEKYMDTEPEIKHGRTFLVIKIREREFPYF